MSFHSNWRESIHLYVLVGNRPGNEIALQLGEGIHRAYSKAQDYFPLFSKRWDIKIILKMTPRALYRRLGHLDVRIDLINKEV